MKGNVQEVDALLLHESEMAGRIRDFDWSSTPLGAPASWPIHLRMALGICLNSRFPMAVRWGPDFINLYNDAYIPIYGKRHPEALGRPAHEVWPDIWPVIGPQFEKVFLSGEATWNERVVVTTVRNGFEEEAWFTWSYSPIPDGSGGIGGLFCAVHEDTPQVIAERERDAISQALKMTQDRVDATLLAAEVGTWDFDILNDVVLPDPNLARLFGLPYEEVAGGVSLDVFVSQCHPDDVDRVRQSLHNAFGSTALRWQSQHRALQFDGSARWVNARGQIERNENGVALRMPGIVLDVTEQKLAEQKVAEALEVERLARSEAERVNQMKDEFLATLSHELRTPLNSILGWANLLRSGRLAEEDRQQAAETIERNAHAQKQLIEDLLDMSRIVSGKVRLDVQQVDLAEVVGAAVDSVLPTATTKGVRLEKVIDPYAGPVSGDPSRLQQVVWNLLSNAIKFTPKDGKVQITLERVNSHLEICVSDTGVGIKPVFLPQVFDRFAQADGTTTRRHGGLGLGLSIVKQIVEMHNGTVRAKSPGQDKGATFIVGLPLAIVHRHSEERRQHPQGNASGDSALKLMPSLVGVKVLVVDDESDARELVKHLLELSEATVVTAGSAVEGLKLVITERPDVILSDIGMPDTDGYSFMRQVRSLGKDQGGQAPAVALTAFARSEDRQRALLSGYQSHIAKPVEAAELLAVVASVTGRVFPQ